MLNLNIEINNIKLYSIKIYLLLSNYYPVMNSTPMNSER